jgi:transcriptional regulator with XRE-family HTH domain
MTHEPHQTSRGPRRPATPAGTGVAREGLKELMRAKMELVAARERGERGALVRLLTAHPAHAAELSDFSAALVATSGYEREELTAETERVAQRAFARAMASVFPAPAAPKPAAAVAQGAVASLKALRRARGLSQMDLARRLGLGPDVLSNLEAGLIRAASIPERFIHALGSALDATVDQVNRAIQVQAMALPALLRSSEGATKDAGEQPQQDFLDAVRFSPDMTAEQKARWLDD